MGETVLVTGAAGTVGGYAVRELIARGHRVVATDRPGCQIDVPAGAPVEVREGDLTDMSFCVDALAGVDAVVHLAATIDLSLPRGAVVRINVEATRTLYEVARARRCRRFVFLSSGAIYKKEGRTLVEGGPLGPRTDYEHSKAEAERWLLGRRDPGPEVVVLRPTMIYGPRARYLGVKLATLPPVLAMLFGKVPRFAGGPVCNWVHAEDVARAALHLLDDPRAAGEIYNVADETPMSFGEVIETMTHAYGLPLGRDLPYPTRLLGVVGPALAGQTLFMRLLSLGYGRAFDRISQRHALAPGIDRAVDRETLLYSATEAIFDGKKLRALGFDYRWKSLREGFPSVLRWYQQHRWLPRYDAAPAAASPDRDAMLDFATV